MKTSLLLATLLIAAVPALASDPAPANPPAAPSAKSNVCLHYNEVDGWGTRDKHSMIVNDIFGHKYLVSLNGYCDDLNFAMGAGFRPVGGAGFCVDRGDHLVTRGGGASHMPSTCWVNKVQLYTKDMEAADKLARANKQPLAAY